MRVGDVECVGRHGSTLLVECGPEAWDFVLPTWDATMAKALHGDVKEGQYKRWLDNRLHAAVKATLERRGVRLLCAVAEGANEVLLGYVAHEDARTHWRLHFAYVREPLRRLGLANALVQAAKGAYTHSVYTRHTPEGARLARRWGLTYAPEEG